MEEDEHERQVAEQIAFPFAGPDKDYCPHCKSLDKLRAKCLHPHRKSRTIRFDPCPDCVRYHDICTTCGGRRLIPIFKP